MKRQPIARALSGITLLIGLVAMLFPAIVGDMFLEVNNPSNRVMGEIAAVMGGTFAVIGALALYGSIMAGPAGILWVRTCGLVWLGLALGRLVAVFTAGPPDWLGWIYLVLEAGVGLAILLASGGVQKALDMPEGTPPPAPDAPAAGD